MRDDFYSERGMGRINAKVRGERGEVRKLVIQGRRSWKKFGSEEKEYKIERREEFDKDLYRRQQ